MTKIEMLQSVVGAVLGSENQMISGEEYLELLAQSKTFAEKELYTQIYNYLLAKRQKEVIANEHY